MSASEGAAEQKKGASKSRGASQHNSFNRRNYYFAIFFGAFFAGFFAFFAITFPPRLLLVRGARTACNPARYHSYTSTYDQCQENSDILRLFPDYFCGTVANVPP
jgi:hypothetical protein